MCADDFLSEPILMQNDGFITHYIYQLVFYHYRGEYSLLPFLPFIIDLVNYQSFLKNKFLIALFYYFLAILRGMWDLGSQPGIEPARSAVEVQSLDHWTTREIPVISLDS